MDGFTSKQICKRPYHLYIFQTASMSSKLLYSESLLSYIFSCVKVLIQLKLVLILLHVNIKQIIEHSKACAASLSTNGLLFAPAQ